MSTGMLLLGMGAVLTVMAVIVTVYLAATAKRERRKIEEQMKERY